MCDVLVLDDEMLNCLLLAEALRDTGLVVCVVMNAVEARQALVQNPPRLLVADVDLGRGGNGIAVAREARQLHPLVIVYYSTGRPSALDGESLGGNDRIFVKPYDLDELAAAANAAIGPRGH